MKTLEFKKYEGGTELEAIGTIAEQIGKKGKVMFSRKNFNNHEKRVVVVAYNEQGESVIVSCSGALSTSLRKAKADGVDKTELLAQVVQLPIYDTENGFFIGFEAGERNEATSLTELTKVKVTNKVTNLEDVAW